jgi:hypothetical protein
MLRADAMANDRLRELLREQREADDGRTPGHPQLSVPRIALGCGNFGGVGSAPEFFGRGLTERTVRQLRSSLERLGVDHVELYLAHDYDPDVPLAEALGAFQAAQDDGLIGGYGVSNFDARQLEAALAAGTPQAVQNSYSLLVRQDEAEVLPLCTERDVAYLAFSPLAGGWLTGKYRRSAPYPAGSRMTQRPEAYRAFVADRAFEALGRLEAIAAGRGTTMAPRPRSTSSARTSSRPTRSRSAARPAR